MNIELDCCGANGAYLRLKDLLAKNQIDLSGIKKINIFAPCNFDEVSFASEGGAGGKATYTKCHPDPEKRFNPY